MKKGMNVVLPRQRQAHGPDADCGAVDIVTLAVDRLRCAVKMRVMRSAARSSFDARS